jgi:hypothetical protein
MPDILVDTVMAVARGIFIGAIAGCVMIWIHRVREKREQERERKAMRELVNSVAHLRDGDGGG